VRELTLYLAAGAVYIAVGLAVPELLFSWIEGAVFLLLAVWVLPALWERQQ
jgi:membrane protein implicated in regulation of membrane protease activity